MKKFRHGKMYKAKENTVWGVYEGKNLTTRQVSTTDKFVYNSQYNWLMKESGAFRIENANNYIDKFEPYITADDKQMYKESQIRSAECAMQGLLSNPSLVPDMDFSYKGVARVACQLASALLREMIDEEYYDEESL